MYLVPTAVLMAYMYMQFVNVIYCLHFCILTIIIIATKCGELIACVNNFSGFFTVGSRK